MSRNLDEKKSDYLLELALEEQLENDEDMRHWEQLEQENLPHEFSEQHKKRMRKIFRKAKRIEFYKEHRKRIVKIAASFLVIICASVITVTQVEAFRMPLLDFFYQVKEKSTFFGVSADSGGKLTKNFQEYEPTYKPEGFVVTEVHEEEKKFYLIYENEKGSMYKFYYFKKFKDFALDTEDAIISDIEINGNKASIIKEESETRVIMYEENSLFFLGGTLSSEEAYKIMESIP
jgi:hypothetical protein